MAQGIEGINRNASNSSGARSNFLYGNILEQKRYMFALSRTYNRDVLDCASGIGWGSYLIAAAGARTVVGIELSDEGVSSAKKYYSAGTITYINSSLAAADTSDASFDVIVSFETLEHVENPIEFLTKLKSLARPDATMFLSTPNGYAFKEPADRPYNPFHLNEFSRMELTRMFASSGWSVVEYRGQYPMLRGSDDIPAYRRFIKAYWSQQRRARSFGLPYRAVKFAGRMLGYSLAEPAFASSCDPVLIDDRHEPAYHYFVLSPASIFSHPANQGQSVW